MRAPQEHGGTATPRVGRRLPGPWRAALLSLPLLGALGCPTPPEARNVRYGDSAEARRHLVSMTPVRWRMGSACAGDTTRPAPSRQRLAEDCPTGADGRDFVAMAISGGGSKAAMFGGEAMFILERLGLLGHLDMLSGVSGGSFAAALYAASCDPGDWDCAAAHPGWPVWEYEEMMGLSQGYRPLVRRAYLRLAVPLLPQTVTPEEFAAFIDACYLGTRRGGCDWNTRVRPSEPLTFADLNPRRPHLVLNNTTVSEYRDIVDQNADCEAVSALPPAAGAGSCGAATPTRPSTSPSPTSTSAACAPTCRGTGSATASAPRPPSRR